MAATRDNPIIFYDLDNGKGSSWSPNPYKTRLCLNYKGLPYRVEYISLPDVEPKMKELGVGPISETFPHYTLPVIADPSSDPDGKPTYVVESFNIAIYLDEKYPAPQYPAIFPPGTRSIQNLLVNQYFPIIVGSIGPVIGPKVPLILDSRSIEYLQRTRGERLKPLSDGEVAQKWQEVFEQFAAMSKSLEINGGGEPFFTGDRVSFFDFALGGLFHMVQKVDSARLREILEWQDGKWDIYWKGVQKIENNSSEVIR